jgi:hypothetical protein
VNANEKKTRISMGFKKFFQRDRGKKVAAPVDSSSENSKLLPHSAINTGSAKSVTETGQSIVSKPVAHETGHVQQPVPPSEETSYKQVRDSSDGKGNGAYDYRQWR